jgi:peroxiredoxin
LLGLLTACAGEWEEAFRPLDVGSPAPAYAAATLAGDTVSLADLSGRAILLNVWATWCIPCREEMPALARTHRALVDSGLVVLGVSVDNARATGEIGRFADEYRIEFMIAHDPGLQVQRTFRTIGVPETFLIDRSGKIVRRWIGQFDPESPDARASILAALER